jgi:formylglycine-generating enzyme required for sulfatase activity
MNGYRIYHMAGNVQEWVWDKNSVQALDPHRYYYELGPELDPRGADGPAYLTRIRRGGAWDLGAYSARCSSWGYRPWQGHNENLGFRTVRRRLLLQ